MLAPDRGLSLVAVGQTRWALAFEARDDYGVAATATLKLTLAQGSGENIAFKEQAMTLHGTSPATSRRFTASLDLAAFGMAVRDDLIALGVPSEHLPRTLGEQRAHQTQQPLQTSVTSLSGDR